MTFILILAGFVLLGIAGEALLRGAVSIGQHLHVSPVVIGLLIVGLGTSMPELFVGVQATWNGTPEIAVGNVIGSNIANIFLILGTAAVIQPFVRPTRAVHPDGTILMIASLGIIGLGMQGIIHFWQGLILIAALGALIVQECVEAQKKRVIKLKEVAASPSAETQDPNSVDPLPLPLSVVLTLVGLFMLPVGAAILIEGASQLAASLGVSAGLIGLTIVAIGTSLPELASVTVASLRGHSELAYGNVVGSNLFNSLGILGASSLAGPLEFPWVMVWFDGLVMIVATLLMIGFIWFGNKLSRIEGGLLLFFYCAYLTVRTTIFV
ncbi:MAG: calcium/sodium antiporter [Methyloligellaceae bacterium]